MGSWKLVSEDLSWSIPPKQRASFCAPPWTRLGRVESHQLLHTWSLLAEDDGECHDDDSANLQLTGEKSWECVLEAQIRQKDQNEGRKPRATV